VVAGLAGLVLELLTTHGIYPGHLGPLSLAIPPWLGAMCIGDGFGHLWEEIAPLFGVS